MKYLVLACLVMAIILVALYGFAYSKKLGGIQYYTNPDGTHSPMQPHYTGNRDFNRVFFLPANMVDRLVRPKRWVTVPPRPINPDEETVTEPN